MVDSGTMMFVGVGSNGWRECVIPLEPIYIVPGRALHSLTEMLKSTVEWRESAASWMKYWCTAELQTTTLP